jgi:hypothetical protein
MAKPWARELDPREDELQYRGVQCARCGAPLLVSEWRHCGPKNPDGMNCGALVARLALHAAGGPQSYRQQMGAAPAEGLFD